MPSPLLPGERAPAAQPVSSVASVLLPALVAPVLDQIAQRLDPQGDTPVHQHLVALTGRLLCGGGWAEGQRHAGAEPLATGRTRAYDESTVRKAARALTHQGAVAVAEDLLQRQVHRATGAACVEAFTDLFDQVYWTKKDSWAAPVGNLGNRLLACTYFGMTFVRPEGGPCLAYHVSWHKPASPLLDAVQALHHDDRRHGWLLRHVSVHILDRGTQGDPALTWMLAQGIPYLTLAQRSVQWKRYHQPTHFTPTGVPIFDRPDVRLHDAVMGVDGRITEPRVVIFPARPEQGDEHGRGLVYRTAARLESAQIGELSGTYKARWPNNENPIKGLVAVGFDRNLDRTLQTTTSRGHDGQVERLSQAIVAHEEQLAQLAEEPGKQAVKRREAEEKKRRQKATKLAKVQRQAQEKGIRADEGGEHLCKVLMLMLWNALALLLWKSPVEAVRTMTLERVCTLLVRQNALAVVEEERVTLYVEAVGSGEDREHQAEVVRLVNEARLRVRGSGLRVKVRDPTGKCQALRVCA